MKRFLILMLLFLATCWVHGDHVLQAQTTITLPGTVLQSNAGRFGVNLGSIWNYGNGQEYKDLFYAADGYSTGIIAETSFRCSSGGTNDSTHWYSTYSGSNGYPVNFWVGAIVYPFNSATGASYLATNPTTVSASSANTSTGLQFTLNHPLTGTCSPSNNDVMIVRQTVTSSYYTPAVMAAWGNGFALSSCSGAIYNTSDKSPASSNNIQSLDLPSGCTETLYTDAVLGNATNTNSGLAATQVPWINLNGNYTLTFKAKCPGPSGSFTVTLERIGGTTFVPTTNESLTCNAGNNLGWSTFNIPFTASETGSQTTSLRLQFVTTGEVRFQDQTAIEGSTLTGNTTPFRDAFVKLLQDLHPDSIRAMSPALWGTMVADEFAPLGQRRWSSTGVANALGFSPAAGYADYLSLAHFLNVDLFLNIGCTNQAADYVTLAADLAANSDYIALVAAGHKVRLEMCNEAWNSGAGATLWEGNGLVYGSYIGPLVAAFKGASGYDSSHMILVGNSWFAPNQSYGPYGWMDTAMTQAAATGGKPDILDIATYTFSYIGAYGTSGSNLSTTGDPWTSMFAEPYNFTTTSPASGYPSVYKSVQDTNSLFGLPIMGYETNTSSESGIGITQLQIDQLAVGVGAAVSQSLLWQLSKEAGVTGPLHVFNIGENWNSYNCVSSCVSGVKMPLWGIERIIATGPGQTLNAATTQKPISIILQLLNNQINTNTNLLNVTQSPPTYSYAGGQNDGSSNTIAANASVPYLHCSQYGDASNDYTLACWNTNPAASESIVLAGVAAPTGAVTKYVFGAGNVITDHNEDTYLGASSISPLVTLPTGSSTSGLSYTIGPAQVLVLAYNNGSVPAQPRINGSYCIGGCGQ